MPECNVTKRERVDFEGVGDGRFRGGRGGFAGNGDGWVAAACAGLTAQPLTLLSFSFAAQKGRCFPPFVVQTYHALHARAFRGDSAFVFFDLC